MARSDAHEVLRTLQEVLPGDEVWEVAHRFVIYRRRRSDDEHQEVDVRLLYFGDKPAPWLVSGRDHDRNITVSANAADDPDTAMRLAHWVQLDGPAIPEPPSEDDEDDLLSP